MTHEEIASVLDRYAEAKNRHDLDAILSLCADECFYESVPLGARIQGKDDLRGFYSALFAALPDYVGEFEGTAYGESSAVVWGRFGGTLSGQFMGVEVEAGRRIEIPVTFVCTFRDGLLVADRGYFDAATLAEQVGVPLESVRPAGTGTAGFVERFGRFWADPDPERVAELVAPDAVITWPGLGPIRGTEYPEHMAGILMVVPDLRLEVTEHAEAGELAFISWRARATVGGEALEWTGIDRFRVRDGRALEGLIAYDSMPLQEALQRVQAAGAAAS